MSYNFLSLHSAESVVYFNIRVKQEGLNRAVLVNELYGESSMDTNKTKAGSKYAPVERAEVEIV